MFRRPLRIRSLIFFSFGVRCSGVPKTPKNQILDFLYSLSWCSDVAFLIVGYRSGAPLVFQRPLNFPFQIFFSGSVRCSGVPKTPKFQISDFRLFIFGGRPTVLGRAVPHTPRTQYRSNRNEYRIDRIEKTQNATFEGIKPNVPGFFRIRIQFERFSGRSA